MATWEDVKKRAKEEVDFSKQVAEYGAQQIERYYPELYSSGASHFTNTLGSNLIPDLLTSERVVVDLYDWPSPDSLVGFYGVDLPFLIALRDAELITVCANLPPDLYKPQPWLFPLLADSRTIFRSIRTPAFVGAIDPNFISRAAAREMKLRRYFNSLTSAELQRICGAVKAAHPLMDAASLAGILAQWLERLTAFEPEIAEEVSDGFEAHIIERLPQLRRLQSLIVSPHTAYLGGTMKIERHRWPELFGDEHVDEAILEGQVRFQSLNSYFSEVQLNLSAVDLATPKLWKDIRDLERRRLLDYLSDTNRKLDLLKAEETIRVGLANGGDRDPTRASIRAYVTKLEGEAERLRTFGDSVSTGIAATIAFGFLNDAVVAGLTLAGGLFAKKYLLGDRIRRLTENVFGKLRVVRVLVKRDD